MGTAKTHQRELPPPMSIETAPPITETLMADSSQYKITGFLRVLSVLWDKHNTGFRDCDAITAIGIAMSQRGPERPGSLPWCLRMDILVRYLREHWRLAAGALFFAIINQIASMADPFIFRRIIDGYVVPRHQAQHEFALGVGLWLLALAGATTIAWAAKTMQLARTGQISQRVASEMYSDGVRHTLEMPYSEFEHSRSGETIEQLQKLRWKVDRLIGTAINVLFVSLVGVIFVLSYAAFVDWAIAVYLAFVAVSMILLSVALSGELREVHDDVHREGTALAGTATETVRNIEFIKSVGLTRRQISGLRRSSGRILELELEGIRRVRQFSFFHGGAVQVMRLGFIGLLLYFMYLHRITVGQFLALYLYGRFLFLPLQQVGTAVQEYRGAEASLSAFRGLLSRSKESRPESPVAVDHLRSIEFDGVRFQYAAANRPAVASLSFQVQQGQTIAFVGPSGAGKTTIVKLLSGLYTPDHGRILYNGVSQDRISLDQLRERIGLVTQESQLFSGTIRQNLLLVRPHATDAECLAALEKASAQSILTRGPDGLDTRIGEGGVRLSGGERQRIAIARALLREPHMVIFDEATSALDSLTEKEISETMRTVAERCQAITILIAHRLSTVSCADVIHVLDRGKIIQSGSHADLVASGGLYREMWLQQVNGEGDSAAGSAGP
jgi:ATP-binding cassette, subfamily B, bacterial